MSESAELVQSGGRSRGPVDDLTHVPLFEGLDATALEAIRGQMKPRHFRGGKFICREGDPGTSLFVIQRGVAQVIIEGATSTGLLARLGRGDVFGEMSLLTGEPRSASVLAGVSIDALELGKDAFATITERYPIILRNISRILSHRLSRSNVQHFARHFVSRHRGHAAALVVSRRGAALAADVTRAARAASARGLVALDLTESLRSEQSFLHDPTVEGAVSALDDLVSSGANALVLADAREHELLHLLDHVDRVVVLGSDAEARRLATRLRPLAGRIGIALLLNEPRSAPRIIDGLPVLRAFDPSRPARDVAWLGRHLSRTKLGLALGAGGAKGYAHVGVLHVLQAAGYTVDYVSGSSVGALVAVWLAIGMDASQIERTMREAFTPENVDAMFKLSLSSTPPGLEVMRRVWRETVGDRDFYDLCIPLVMMAVDLNTRLPAPITDGQLWQAMVASHSIAGLFPPYQRDGQRLVDAVALVPVPTDAVREAGADVVVSVNLLSRDGLPDWPGDVEPEPSRERSGSRMLDTLLEVIDLGQIDSSTRHAVLADVVITPRFGPATWRDFHLADLFLDAGRAAAEEELSHLRRLARPPSTGLEHEGGVRGNAAVHV
jgi:NTE family protein